MTNTDIAKRIGVSDATIRRRLARLEEESFLRIVAVANPFKLGFNIITIIGIRVDAGRLREVEEALVAIPQVRFVGVTLGAYDLMLEAWFRTNEEMLEFLTETLGQLVGIQRSESFQIIRLSKYSYDWGQQPSARLAPVTE